MNRSTLDGGLIEVRADLVGAVVEYDLANLNRSRVPCAWRGMRSKSSTIPSTTAYRPLLSILSAEWRCQTTVQPAMVVKSIATPMHKTMKPRWDSVGVP